MNHKNLNTESSLIKNLTDKQQAELFQQLNYLNISEYQSFCKKHRIPFHIHIELPNGKLKKTSDRFKSGDHILVL